MLKYNSQYIHLFLIEDPGISSLGKKTVISKSLTCVLQKDSWFLAMTSMTNAKSMNMQIADTEDTKCAVDIILKSSIFQYIRKNS